VFSEKIEIFLILGFRFLSEVLILYM
jgi:hypothetical protein